MRKVAIGAFTLGALLTMAGLRVADLQWTRAEALESAESHAANLALIISAYLGEAFAAGDASLRQLALHSRRVGGPRAPERNWAPTLASAKAGLTSVGAITIVDRDGVIRHSTRPQIVGQSRRDDYLVRRVLDAPARDLIIGTPFQITANPPQHIIPIGRPLTSEQGTVEGAVVASFIPAVPRGFFRNVDVGDKGTVWVFHPDGVVLFREPSPVNPIGQEARTNPIFMAASKSGLSGLLRDSLEAGGSTLLSAFHTTSTPPLIVAVSLDQGETLADWQHEAQASAVLFTAIAITLVATLVVLFWQMEIGRAHV